MIALRCFFDIKTHRFYAVIAWFNGGLFKTIDIPPLTIQDLAALRTAAETLDWRSIEPVIFGTLFERGLNPLARAPLATIVSRGEAARRHAEREVQRRAVQREAAGAMTREVYEGKAEQKRASARLLRAQGKTWAEVAKAVGYKDANSARVACR